MREAAILVAVLIVLAVAVTPSALAQEQTRTKTYVGSGLPAWTTPKADCSATGRLAPASHVSGACFEVPPGSSALDVRIEDTLAPVVAGGVVLYDAFGQQVRSSNGFVCDGANLDLPGSATHAVVFVSSPAGSSSCPSLVGGTAASAGTITATFSS